MSLRTWKQCSAVTRWSKMKVVNLKMKLWCATSLDRRSNEKSSRPPHHIHLCYLSTGSSLGHLCSSFWSDLAKPVRSLEVSQNFLDDGSFQWTGGIPWLKLKKTEISDCPGPPWPMWMQIASRMASKVWVRARKRGDGHGFCVLQPPCDVAVSGTTPEPNSPPEQSRPPTCRSTIPIAIGYRPCYNRKPSKPTCLVPAYHVFFQPEAEHLPWKHHQAACHSAGSEDTVLRPEDSRQLDSERFGILWIVVLGYGFNAKNHKQPKINKTNDMLRILNTFFSFFFQQTNHFFWFRTKKSTKKNQTNWTFGPPKAKHLQLKAQRHLLMKEILHLTVGCDKRNKLNHRENWWQRSNKNGLFFHNLTIMCFCHPMTSSPPFDGSRRRVWPHLAPHARTSPANGPTSSIGHKIRKKKVWPKKTSSFSFLKTSDLRL